MANKIDKTRMEMRRVAWAAAGFSLVEIMVGMVVGLLTIIVIMQSFAAFEGQKRTTTSGSDTQENGLIALQAIESDARSAGYGLLTPKGLACTSMNYYEKLSTSVVSGVASIAPVAVSDVGASDSVIFTAATSPIAGMPSKLNADMPNAMADADIDNSVGFTIQEDLFLVAAPIASPGVGAVEIPCSRLAYTSGPTDANAIYNTSDTNFFPTGGYPMNNGFVINIGKGINSAAGFVRMQYRVNSNNDLLAEDVSHMFAQSAVVLASNIVNMQVQYGVAPVNSQPGIASPAVSCWTDAIDASLSATAPADCKADWRAATITASNVMRIKAIRLAVVARSSLQEKPSVVGGSCDATPGTVISWPGGPAVDLSANASWRCYRYRVYQTVIPLRNVIWANI